MSDDHDDSQSHDDDSMTEWGSSTEAHYAAQELVQQMVANGHDQYLVACGLMEMAARAIYALGCRKQDFMGLAEYAYNVGERLESYAARRDRRLNPKLN